MKLSKSNITLYADSRFISPYAMSVFVTLKEKNIPFEIRKIDLDEKENLHENYVDLSLTSRVPTLSNGTFNLSESSAITEYLEELFPPPRYTAVYPNDIQEKARARQIQAWLRSDFMPIRDERSTEVIFCSKKSASFSGAAKISSAKLFSAIENLLKDGSSNLFNQWCIADTDLALMLNRLIMNGDDVPDKLAHYAKHQWQKKSVQQWVELARNLKQVG
ncbi:MAG: glutathione S-transferase [Desulforhopalus sp.]|jgi:glutathione S-transferase